MSSPTTVRVVEQTTTVRVVDNKPTVRIVAPGPPGPSGPVGPAGEGLTPGGSTGQHLAKVSATDFDAQWVSLNKLDRFEGSEITLTSNGQTGSVAHGLGTAIQVWGVLRNKAAEFGYNVGDEVNTYQYQNYGFAVGVQTWIRGSSVHYIVGQGGISVFDAGIDVGNGVKNVTLSSWKLVLRAFG